MTPPLIPAALLEKSDKILFIAHLALGDFTYLQNCFRAFALAYPHLKIDLWVDEVRRTSDAAKWPFLQKYALYDWVAHCPFFHTIYNRTYSPALLKESIAQAKDAHYPIIVSLATLRPNQYANLAREIGPDSFIAGMRKRSKFYQLHYAFAYRKLDAAITPWAAPASAHITDIYANWFEQLCGLRIPASARFPFVDLPEQWQTDANERLERWGWLPKSGPLIFINPYAKTKKRCWPLARVVELIKAMQADARWQHACFVVNAVPEAVQDARTIIEGSSLPRTRLFSAQENFFELPALLGKCDLIISVETAVMHLANAVHVPVVALMRQKNPEWAPFDQQHSTIITASSRREWVDAITVAQVMKVLK